MTPKQNLIFFLLLTLLIVHGFASGQFGALAKGVVTSQSQENQNQGKPWWEPWLGIIGNPFFGWTP